MRRFIWNQYPFDTRVGERGMLTDTQLIDQLSPNAGPHDIMVDRLLLDKTSDDRLMLAKKF